MLSKKQKAQQTKYEKIMPTETQVNLNLLFDYIIESTLISPLHKPINFNWKNILATKSPDGTITIKIKPLGEK